MSEHYDNILLDGGAESAPPPRGVDRRDFLKIAGFTLGGALIAGCKPARVEKAIPFLVKPEEVTPGVASWYATTCGGCSAGCGVMVKNRDGRPVKLEGIPGHPVSDGGLCPVGQASLLGLYDSRRAMTPLRDGRPSAWDEIDRHVSSRLDGIASRGGAIRILTGTMSGPSARAELARFLARYPGAKHVEYDAYSHSAILDAHERTHGVRVLPRYGFDKAEVIASFDADFLGTWISPVEFTSAYRAGRRLEGSDPRHSYHVQIESRVSLTGSNADERLRLSPAEIRGAIHALASLVAARAGAPSAGPAPAGEAPPEIARLADRLWEHRGRCLVVAGINEIGVQMRVNEINAVLGNYAHAIDIARPSLQRLGNDAALEELLGELKSGRVSALIIRGANPVYDLSEGNELAKWIASAELSILCGEHLDETAAAVQCVCPEPHPLESWSDAEPQRGVYTITQPVIAAFGTTRTFSESLSRWTGGAESAYDLLRRSWESSVYPAFRADGSFTAFWDAAVSRGYAALDAAPASPPAFIPAAMAGVRTAPADGATGLSLVLYTKVAMPDGRHAHNPWLQELPDPVTKIVWDNYAVLSPAAAEGLGAAEGDVVLLQAPGASVELPVHIQPGQHDAVVAVALGYGRMGTDRFADVGPDWLEAAPTVQPGALVGVNAAALVASGGGSRAYDLRTVAVVKTGRRHPLACTQEHHSLHVPEHLAPKNAERRPIIQETTLAAYRENPQAGAFEKTELLTMWPEDHRYDGHRWGMSIDLSACTGCSACVVSCKAENNIPLVGKDEVSRNREMTWIRIDRYYDETPGGGITVQHQPMMCQHCGNAPCETVCPVLATVHSDEGLNQQVYNRCVGTRYCSNNCPYKVRRFNWFEYEHGDDMRRLALNPDIAVRERGVMEKCSMCVQRIQEAKIEAKKKGMQVKDGDIQPACAQSCPAKAIAFGDMNDPASLLAQRRKDPRSYGVLEEIGVHPSVVYMTLIRNRQNGEAGHV